MVWFCSQHSSAMSSSISTEVGECRIESWYVTGHPAQLSILHLVMRIDQNAAVLCCWAVNTNAAYSTYELKVWMAVQSLVKTCYT